MTDITTFGHLVSWVLGAYLVMLFARMVIQVVFSFSRPWIPSTPTVRTGVVVALFEGAFSATDPPLKLLRRYIPPLRLGNVAFDLGFLLLFIVIVVLMQYAKSL